MNKKNHILNRLLLWSLILASGPGLLAQPVVTDHVEAELVPEFSAVHPGGAFTLAVRLKMIPEWHTYWLNSGDSGDATKIEWNVEPGYTVGPIQWPYPEEVAVEPFMTYAYHDEVYLLNEVIPPTSLEPGEMVTISAEVDWLVCREICLPESASLTITMPVTEEELVPTQWQDEIEATRLKLPIESDAWSASATFENGSYALTLDGPVDSRDRSDIIYFPVDPEVVEYALPKPVVVQDGSIQIEVPQSEWAEQSSETLRAVLVSDAGWDESGIRKAMLIEAPVAGGGALTAATAPAATSSISLWLALVLAFAGGLILNLMPCVFPVLSLKVLGFADLAGQDSSKTRRHGLVFAAGVVLSFLALAGALIALREAGEVLGWGFQLQSPLFVAAMAALMFALGLSLMGVMELGSSLTRLGGKGAEGGYSSSFWSGVLATVVATPCTAPFMGSALGYAMVQPAAIALLVFAVLGIGMAIPYVILTASPALIDRLPRPGAWMETFKQALAFPMFATAVWLIWVFGQQTGVNGVGLLLLGFTALALALWILGRWNAISISPRTRLVTRSLVAISLGLAVYLVWQGSRYQEQGIALTADSVWQPYDEERIAELRAAGQPVFLDFTAAWCLSCKVNETVALNTSSVMAAFEELDVTLFKADWTRYDAEITEALERFGRSGVPVYVLYDGESEPILLPEILTPGIVLDALDGLREARAARQQ